MSDDEQIGLFEWKLLVDEMWRRIQLLADRDRGRRVVAAVAGKNARGVRAFTSLYLPIGVQYLNYKVVIYDGNVACSYYCYSLTRRQQNVPDKI